MKKSLLLSALLLSGFFENAQRWKIITAVKEHNLGIKKDGTLWIF